MPYRNIQLHPILRLIYFLFRLLAWFGMGVFFRRRLVLGAENFRFDGPAIIITNHPSTLMDVFNPGLPVRQEMFFLANYGLFKHPISNWLFRRLFSIPVKRREDVADGEERSNDAAFRQSYQHLEKNGVLFVAPEGTSWMNRWVREFKTGTARIAFGVESHNHWKLGVKIIPVGLSYSAPHLFRSDVVVNCGEAVWPQDWADEWRKNPSKAVGDFTAELQRRVAGLTVHARDEAGEKLVNHWEEMLENERPNSFSKNFQQLKSLAETQLDNEEFRSKTTEYFDMLDHARLSDLGIKTWAEPSIAQRTFADSFLLVFGLPFFAVGYLFWFLPCYLPWLLNKKMNLYIGYSSTVKMLAGLATFSLALWAAYRYLPGLLGWQGGGVPIVLSLVVFGYFAERYSDVVRRAGARFRASRFARAQPDVFATILLQRRGLMSMMDALRQTNS